MYNNQLMLNTTSRVAGLANAGACVYSLGKSASCHHVFQQYTTVLMSNKGYCRFFADCDVAMIGETTGIASCF